MLLHTRSFARESILARDPHGMLATLILFTHFVAESFFPGKMGEAIHDESQLQPNSPGHYHRNDQYPYKLPDTITIVDPIGIESMR